MFHIFADAPGKPAATNSGVRELWVLLGLPNTAFSLTRRQRACSGSSVTGRSAVSTLRSAARRLN
jgi:hypothetical protein